MCGVVGYVGKKEALPIIIDGLKRLEYRGYDSAGICVKNEANFFVAKKRGKVQELENQIEGLNISGSTGIAHTRWATHGEPNEINAHPHLDCKGNIAIVHNGIFENYQSLKDILEKEGHKFVSKTDTEIMAHLVEKFYQGNLEEAIAKALKLVEGTFGLLVVDKNEDKIIAAKRSAPLVVGLGDGEMFVASALPAILNHTKKVVYLDDNEMAVISKDGYKILNFDGQSVDKEISQVQMTMDQIEKKGFKHFMLKEIFEQPEAIENTLRGRIYNGKIKLSLDLDLNQIKRIVIVACGTSWHSALIGKYLIEKLAKVPVEVDYASEFRYRNPIVNHSDLVVAISQSGETADTLAALKEAKQKGAKTAGIVNVVGSTIAREVDSGIYLHAGPEIGVASTKAFTCQVVALLLFGLYLKQNKEELNKDFLEEINNIPQKVREVLSKSEEIRNLAESFKDVRNFLYLGRNVNFPVALEGALKLKEISYIHAEGYPAAEMKHGPIALIDENMPVVFVSPSDSTYQKVLSNMEEIKARKGNIIAVVNKDDDKIKELANYIIKVPESAEDLSAVINVVPLQLLAYYIADLKGLNVDKPRNLAKSVTVE